jgi:F-type H+-transporting ATPase subunit gamma
MTQRRSLERRRRSLGEIREIMDSMKTLAYLETHKISRTLDAQRAVVRHVETVAADLFAFHPELRPPPARGRPVYLLLGSERGFCGDFNRALARALDAAPESAAALVVAVGAKLAPLLEQDARLTAALPGPGVSEEIGAVLDRIAAAVAEIERREGSPPLSVVYNNTQRGVVTEVLWPPFQAAATPSFGHPPVLDLEPRDLVIALADQYLLAVLQLLLYDSLMAENRSRVAHLEGAVRHLDEEAAKLSRRGNALRQEEIVEEIEVILQSAASVARLGEQD